MQVPTDYYHHQELTVFHQLVAVEACLRRCKEKEVRECVLHFLLRPSNITSLFSSPHGTEVGVFPRAGVSSYVMDHMRNKDAYNYLQLALFKVTTPHLTRSNNCLA